MFTIIEVIALIGGVTLLVIVASAMLAGGTPGSLLTARLLPPEIVELAERAWPSGAIRHAEFSPHYGWLMQLADRYGTQRDVRVQNDRRLIWLYDSRQAWEQFRSYILARTPPIDPDTSKALSVVADTELPVIDEAVAGAGLQPRKERADLTVRCGWRLRDPQGTELIIDMVNTQEGSVWRAAGTVADSDQLGQVVKALLTNYPPWQRDDSDSRR